MDKTTSTATLPDIVVEPLVEPKVFETLLTTETLLFVFAIAFVLMILITFFDFGSFIEKIGDEN